MVLKPSSFLSGVFCEYALFAYKKFLDESRI